jgi:hypothetical protein
MDQLVRIACALASVIVLAACAAASGPVVQNPTCLAQTGSRIPAGGMYCSATGRSYTRDDVNQTGATNGADALRLLDPSVATR